MIKLLVWNWIWLLTKGLFIWICYFGFGYVVILNVLVVLFPEINKLAANEGLTVWSISVGGDSACWNMANCGFLLMSSCILNFDVGVEERNGFDFFVVD